MENLIKAVNREEYLSASSPTQESQKLEGKPKQDYFLPQVLDSYKPEALRVHRLESNIINNKHNWSKIIHLGILHHFVIYCNTPYIARYDHVHSYSMLCDLISKDFFIKCHTIMVQIFFQI